MFWTFISLLLAVVVLAANGLLLIETLRLWKELGSKERWTGIGISTWGFLLVVGLVAIAAKG